MTGLENLVEGRHVYFWPRGCDHHVAAIVAHVDRDPALHEPTGKVALTIFNRAGIASAVEDVGYLADSALPQGSGGWTWMFSGQEQVSTAGARPTKLERPLEVVQHRVSGGLYDREMMEALGDDPWKHRSEGMRCATCMFYVAKEPGQAPAESKPLGRCRRHAPTMSGYPVVFPTDWCGDHKLDEAKA